MVLNPLLPSHPSHLVLPHRRHVRRHLPPCRFPVPIPFVGTSASLDAPAPVLKRMWAPTSLPSRRYRPRRWGRFFLLRHCGATPTEFSPAGPHASLPIQRWHESKAVGPATLCPSCGDDPAVASTCLMLIWTWLISAYLLSHNTIHSTSRALFIESAEQTLGVNSR
jgi:hypothetical protein